MAVTFIFLQSLILYKNNDKLKVFDIFQENHFAISDY